VSTRRARVALCGEKRIAENCLEFLHAREDTELCAIVTEEGDWDADLIQWGARHQRPVFVGNINHFSDALAALDLDYLLSVQYRKLVRMPVLALAKKGALNLHFGLLPRYGGCYPLAWALLNGEAEAGATLHFMSEHFDEGDIVEQVSVPVTPRTTARELYDAVSAAALQMFVATYPKLLDGNASRRPQDLTKRLYYPRASLDFAKDSVIAWHAPAQQVQRQICAFTFEPFQLPRTRLRDGDGAGREVTATDTTPWAEPAGRAEAPGTLLEIRGDGSVLIATEGGALQVAKLDKRPAAAYCEEWALKPHATRFE